MAPRLTKSVSEEDDGPRLVARRLESVRMLTSKPRASAMKGEEMPASQRNQAAWRTTKWARRGARVASGAFTAAVLGTAMAACGGPDANAPAADSPASKSDRPTGGNTARSSPAAEVTFVNDAGGEGGESSGRVEMKVIAASGLGVHVTISMFTDPNAKDPEEVMGQTWDGSRLLTFDSMGDPQYVLYEAVNEHPDAWNGLGLWSRELIGPTTGTTCNALDRSRTILKRVAAGYRCATVATEQQDGFSADYWFDKDTGVLLETGPLHAATFRQRPSPDKATFATTPPSGSHATVVAARKPSSGGTVHVPPFDLELLTTGRATSATYAGHSYVLAFFNSDTYWDSPDSCAGCLSALKTLQQLTTNGTTPPVLAVQVGEKGKPGFPLVPPGITLPIANDPTRTLRNALGLSNQLTMAFVGADGTVKVSYDSAPTPVQLTQALASVS